MGIQINDMDGNNIRACVAQIKSRLTMRDVLSRYGLLPQYGDRIPCPLHHGEHKNFLFRPNYYRCFVCGESGTVIDFVARYTGISTKEDIESGKLDMAAVVRRINEDFALDLPIDRYQSTAERRKAKALEANREIDTAYQRMRDNLATRLNQAIYIGNHLLYKELPKIGDLSGLTDSEALAIREKAFLEWVADGLEDPKKWEKTLVGADGMRAERIASQILSGKAKI